MYSVGRRFNVCTVGHFSVVRPPKNFEVSSCVLKSLAAHLSSWNGRGLHDLWGLFGFVLIQLLEHWLQNFEPLIFLRFSEVGAFWEVFLVSFAWMWLLTLMVTLATCILAVCGSSLLWRFLPVGGVGWVDCQSFLVRGACIGVLVGGAGLPLSGVQWSVQ